MRYSMRIKPEISGIYVVLNARESFAPAIFTPAWFELHGLLPDGTSETANLGVSHRQVTVFETDWLNLEVNTNQFIASTNQEPFIRVRDLVLRVFRERLSQTPISALGINRDVHFKVGTAAEREHIGRQLAPLAPWGELGQELRLDELGAGMSSLTMSQHSRHNKTGDGQFNITIEPSRQIAADSTGVYVRVNHHYAIEDAEVDTTSHFMALLADNFETTHRHSDKMIDHIMALASTEET